MAGRQRRAPLWMRRLALEWLWRALSDPARLGPRYLASATVIPGQVRHALRLRRAR
ncbi:MAG: WecB/TagA/CpsF family glycosyltransferase [Gemmobacter sp.]